MKMASVYIDKWCRNNNLSLDIVRKVGDFHDEAQTEVIDDEKYIELFSSFAVKGVQMAGEFFNLKCPLEADVKVGLNWAQTH